MKYRQYGRAGIEVSEIGLGGHREGVETENGILRNARFFRDSQERARVVGRAIDNGVTYFDSTFGCEIESLGESFRLLGKRDGLFVSGMRVDFFANLLADELDVRRYTRREVESRIREFGFDHIDQFVMGAMESGDPLSHPKSILDDAFDELYKMRDEGKLKYVGFSCHDPDYAARLLVEYANFDAVMVPYNFINRTAESNLADAVKMTGAAWIGMKSLVWQIYGIAACVIKHLLPVERRLEHDPNLPVARMAMQYILENPLLATCVPASNSIECVDENCQASGRDLLNEADHRALQAYAAANTAEDSVPLAIGGLFEYNARTLCMSISLLNRVLGIEVKHIDWAADDAETCAQQTAKEIIATLRSDPKWAPMLPS